LRVVREVGLEMEAMWNEKDDVSLGGSDTI